MNDKILTDRAVGLLREALADAEWCDKNIYPVDGEGFQNWRLQVYLPVPLSAKDKSPEAALRAALEQEEQKEQDARAEQIMSEIWAQPDQTYGYIGAKLAENMQKAMKNRARVSIDALRAALEHVVAIDATEKRVEKTVENEHKPVAWATIYMGRPTQFFKNDDAEKKARAEIERLNREYPQDGQKRYAAPLYTHPPRRECDDLYSLLEHAEVEMRYAGWGHRQEDNFGRFEVYSQVLKALKEKNT